MKRSDANAIRVAVWAFVLALVLVALLWAIPAYKASSERSAAAHDCAMDVFHTSPDCQ